MPRETSVAAELRWRKLELLQQAYPDFNMFLMDVIENLMQFKCTRIQLDIGTFLSTGPKYAMVQAQRSQAKTTITAIYAVWCLIHNPTTRVLIVSAGGPLAKQIANWIIQIINGMPELECMRPDTSNGDRSSVEAFDVHYSLKGPEKSPSVACLGVTSNMNGYRADLLIADDIENSKNSRTDVTRELLKQLTRDFTSICANGKILYLGTPQSVDSIYNGLPSRGYTVRVWTGRYPTTEEEGNYGGLLAPMLSRDMEADPSLRSGGGPDGTRGKPTDPVLLNEETLTKKELDQGPAYFQLQHMLDTRLMDSDRYPLKLSNLLVFKAPADKAPSEFTYIPDAEYKYIPPTDFYVDNVDMYKPRMYSEYLLPYEGTHMYIDPSGGGKNADELAYCITRFCNGYIHLVRSNGLHGGFSDANKQIIADDAVKYKVTQVTIEDNYGNGIFRSILTPIIIKAFKDAGYPAACSIDGVHETGQKERRIINTLDPVIAGHKLVVDPDVILDDIKQCRYYAVDKRSTYSLFAQIARITFDPGCLAHDDRLDALAGSCRYWTDQLVIDQEQSERREQEAAWNALVADPLGNGRGPKLAQGMRDYDTIFDKYKG